MRFRIIFLRLPLMAYFLGTVLLKVVTQDAKASRSGMFDRAPRFKTSTAILKDASISNALGTCLSADSDPRPQHRDIEQLHAQVMQLLGLQQGSKVTQGFIAIHRIIIMAAVICFEEAEGLQKRSQVIAVELVVWNRLGQVSASACTRALLQHVLSQSSNKLVNDCHQHVAC